MEIPTQYLDRSQRYEIWRCDRCGHRTATGNTSAALLAKIYGHEFHASSQQHVSEDQAAFRSPVEKNAEARAAWLHTMGLKGKLLDIGAGQGAFVAAASTSFEAAGLELSPEAAESARRMGLSVETGSFVEGPAPAGGYDVVTMWDVLAGFTDVREALCRAAGVLRHGGVLIVTVPDTSSLAARMLGKRWPLLIPPVNLHFFTRKSITLLMEQAGLAVAEATHQSKRVALQFLVSKAGRSFGIPGLAGLAGLLPRSVDLHINTHDILTVVARKHDGRR